MVDQITYLVKDMFHTCAHVRHSATLINKYLYLFSV